MLESIIALFLSSETLTVYVPKPMKNFLADSPRSSDSSSLSVPDLNICWSFSKTTRIS